MPLKVQSSNLVSHFEGERAGTTELIGTDSETRLGLILAAIVADVSTDVVNEGQVTQGLSEVDGTVFTIAVVKGVGSRDDTVVEGVDGLVEGPSTADDISGSVGESVIGVAQVVTIRTD